LFEFERVYVHIPEQSECFDVEGGSRSELQGRVEEQTRAAEQARAAVYRCFHFARICTFKL